ncbi:MAG: ATP-binding cassette domain-containing protein [Gemmatimonadales bacterium]|nr:ATP-binding cassette domain-containing protein [Gemmatimonadales bacterium]NIN13099.1 ATP-binding cassette domain-containing protein [Gemmatimonadales bacterium]NIN51183.1 ATP-binding cassette domain-containing protein [Gemmatimonadales bacterium]NIP08647.1 ATP-binding cassette domain-containing protein [Gemmatimonadales bacterium]NIR02335.1 ATP-binding cassette domain-containing protein [Gemmatimonadales bacterium]
MNPLLSVRHLRTSFETNGSIARAVDGVSFDLFPGETLGLVGESGCGKTVTALSILRLVSGPTGHIVKDSVIEYQGTDLLRLPPRELRRIRGAEIAMIFQEPTTSLNPVLTVGTQIAETLRAHTKMDRKGARRRAIELLELVGIPDPESRVDDYPHQLSGGMQQRVMIAMALSCDPKILIADEPTTALDVTIQAQILALLAKLKRRLGMAMILITHDLGIVAGLADRIAVMYGGQIVEQAPTDILFQHPQHPYTEALLKAVPRIDRPTTRLAAIPGMVPRATKWPTGCRFHPRCQHVWERCRVRMPDLLTWSPEQHSRCWLVEEPERRQE